MQPAYLAAAAARRVLRELSDLVCVAESRVARTERQLAFAQQSGDTAITDAVAARLRRDRAYLAERESSLKYWQTYRECACGQPVERINGQPSTQCTTCADEPLYEVASA